MPEAVPPPLWLRAGELRRLLPLARVVEALEAALATAGSHAASGHAALGCDVEGGAFHVKATTLGAPRAVYIAKINANFPGNPQRGLPTIQGIAALFDAVDGRQLALLDSPELTALRTGAATAVAARRLARPDSRKLLVCGAGRQAFAQVAALATVLDLEKVLVHDLEADRAARLAARIDAELGLSAEGADSVASSARLSDLIVTCTTARAPILHLGDVAPGTFIAAVGADHPSKQELEPALVGATRCFVDSLEQALAAGELHHAVAAGALRPGDIAGRLDQLVDGSVVGRRTPEEITLFDSTGIAIEDAAAALAAYEQWRQSSAAGSRP